MEGFKCAVCFEERTERLPLPKLCTLNGDVLRTADCNHPVCQRCMAAFVVARVEEQRVFGIRCPFEACKNELHEQDVQKLVELGALDAGVSKRLAELRKQDYSARISALTEEVRPLTVDDFRLMKKLWASTRRCPRCSVLMEKSEGCNSFGCICGHRFNFSQAPRGCGDGIENFDSVISLAADFEMPLEEAKQCVKDGQKKGIAKYQQVLTKAKQKQISISLAEVHVQAMLGNGTAQAQLRDARHGRKVDKRAVLLMDQLGMSQDEAWRLLDMAKAGDPEAWTKIRQAKDLQAAAQSRGTMVCTDCRPSEMILTLQDVTGEVYESNATLSGDISADIQRHQERDTTTSEDRTAEVYCRAEGS